MTSDRDSAIQYLFDQARADLGGGAFTQRVMSQIDRGRRRSMLSWVGIGIALVLCAWLVSEPLISVVGLGTSMLPESLVEIDNRWLAQLLSPVNSVATVVGVAILIVWGAYRKLFG